MNITGLLLIVKANKDAIKSDMSDVGLFVSVLEDGTQFDILKGSLLGYKGAITYFML